MKFKILIILILAIFIVALYKTYPIIKERYFGESDKKIITTPIETEQEQQKPEVSFPEDSIKDEEEKIEDEQETLKQEGKIFLKITRENCENECEGFSNGDLEYCQEVCDLKPIQENVSGCENTTGIKKDYCFKDLAISKKDFKICDEIIDENIKKTCKNRILEEIIEE